MEKLGLFANCKVVEGASRKVICDLQRGEVYFISDELCEILTKHLHKSRGEILSLYDAKYHEHIAEYFEYLEAEEVIFWDEVPELFVGIDLTYEYPGWIHNAILERDKNTTYNISEALKELTELGCQFIELRFYDPISLEELTATLSKFERSIIRNIDVYVPYTPDLVTPKEFDILPLQFQRVGNLIVHSAPRIDSFEYGIKWTTSVITDNTHCGKVGPKYFSPNLSFYIEAQAHNTCLNRKVSVSPRGEIMNCPSLGLGYGHIGVTSLESIVTNPAFQKLWGIHKNQIQICKDCEFRYVCSDCRAFLQTDDPLSKPSKCSYDPYTGTWADGTEF